MSNPRWTLKDPDRLDWTVEERKRIVTCNWYDGLITPEELLWAGQWCSRFQGKITGGFDTEPFNPTPIHLLWGVVQVNGEESWWFDKHPEGVRIWPVTAQGFDPSFIVPIHPKTGCNPSFWKSYICGCTEPIETWAPCHCPRPSPYCW